MVRADSRELELRMQSLGVLIVENAPYMRKLIRYLLHAIGITRIEEAADGIQGLEAIRTFEPDIMLLDWEMPLLSGSELVRIVRSPDVFPMPELPVIVVSSHCDRRRVLEALHLGVNEYLVKPISLEALRSRIISVLLKSRWGLYRDDFDAPLPRAPAMPSEVWDVSV